MRGGLLGMAFHPDFVTNGFVYVSYTPMDGAQGMVTRIARFHSPDGGLTLDPASETIVFQQAQARNNHNASLLAFGPDGYLYITIGDDAARQQTLALRAADPSNFYGTVLRIDVDGAAPYSIPADNPFRRRRRARGFRLRLAEPLAVLL